MTVQEMHNELKKTWEEFKKEHTQCLEEHGKEIGQTTEKLEKMNDRIDELETRLKQPAPEDSIADEVFDDQARRWLKARNIDVEAAALQTRAYLKWVRGGSEGNKRFELTPEEARALATDDDSKGGFLMPVNTQRNVLLKLRETSPVREVASIETISEGDVWEQPKEGADVGASWTGERTSITETSAGDFELVRIPVHEMYAEPQLTQKSLEDPFIDLEDYINARLANRFGRLEAKAFIDGDGSGKPTGLLTDSNITVVNSGNASTLSDDGLVDLVYELPAPYAANASFLMHRKTHRDIRKIKQNNEYVWQPGLQAGQPALLLGYPVREATDMPVVAADATPILFGDFRQGYTIVDRIGMSQLRDPYTNKPFVKFYTRRRVGGKVVLAEAIVKQKVAT